VARLETRPARVRAPKVNPFLLAALLLSILSLFLEQGRDQSAFRLVFTQTIDFTILLLFYGESALAFIRTPRKREFLRQNLFDVTFLVVFSGLFAYNKYLFFSRQALLYGNLPGKIIVLRNTFVMLKVFGRVRRLGAFLRGLTAHPARTVVLSFLLVILTGTVLLMMPFTTPPGKALGFLNSLFTATSAVCVTGLIVVDTPTAFNFAGQLIVLLLIQIGGLGIMILSFFMAFVLRRSLTVEDKYLIAYMTSERDMRHLGSSIKSIIYITLTIEAAGAVLLFVGFVGRLGASARTMFISVFHAVSAFCNAGFSLFSDSLEGFVSQPLVNVVICLLIICGGLSFVVITDLRHWMAGVLAGGNRRQTAAGLSLNTRVVLVATGVLLILGTLAIYALEHRNTLAELDLGSQYLAAFFQSVTTRTAGFNTIPMDRLGNPTYLVVMVLMFIGGASGSTAGGVKVNSLALFLAYVRALLQDRQEVTLFNHSVARDIVLRALLILLFGLAAVLAGMLVLSISENARFEHICFEAVSAFGTVGLSAGITAGLSIVGKYAIIVLMFVGRVGPLTLLAAAAQHVRRGRIEYPAGEILIG
jgi:trk system potassium uptake protein TrkH